MSYIQLPFKFILQNPDEMINYRLLLLPSMYFTYIPHNIVIDYPYIKPSYNLDNYQTLEQNWKIECIKDLKFRDQLKSELVVQINNIHNFLITTRNKKSKTDYFRQFLFDYKFYHKQLVDFWIEIWNEVNVELESLETILLFRRLLDSHCRNQKALEIDNYERNDLWRESAREMKSEQKYWNDNYYEEGGGGQDWSDPFD